MAGGETVSPPNVTTPVGNMASITDGIGPSFGPAVLAGRQAASVSPLSAGPTGRRQPAPSVGEDGIGRFGDLGRLYEARKHVWTEAVRVRNLDQKLSRVADRAGEVRVKLEQVKLYPPYPVDEPRRAEAIREFNGIAEEVKRRATTGEAPKIGLTALKPHASTAEAEHAAESLGQVREQFQAERATLARNAASGAGAEAESGSHGVGVALGEAHGAGLSVRASDLLRQIA